MTNSQLESIHLMYVNACNGFLYSEDLFKDESLHPSVRLKFRVLRDKFNWIKKAIEVQVGGDHIRKIDSLMYDNLNRFLVHLSPTAQQEIERLVIAYITEKYLEDGKVDSLQELSEAIHSNDSKEESK